MAKDIIRNDTNYGDLVVIELNGVRCFMQERYAQMLKLPIVEADDIPEFNTELAVEVAFPNGVTQAFAYVQQNSDVRLVAASLSARTGYQVRVRAYARFLAEYANGVLVTERKITDFYSNLTPQQIGKVSF